jgi:hypothetical protein
VASQFAYERRRRLIHRALPLLGGVAVLALGGGIVIGRAAESGSERVANDFSRAWQRGDYAAMYDLLTDDAKGRYPRASFEQAYANARATATVSHIAAGGLGGESGGKVRVPVTVSTRVFGRIEGDVRIPISEEAVEWTPDLVFPGLGTGQRLARETRAPERADILSVDGKVLASGAAGARTHPDDVGSSIAGQVGKPTEAKERLALYSRGFPPDTPVGTTGLERALEVQVAGTPGGRLRAGGTVLAQTEPRAARAVRTTIDSRVQAAAVTALAGRLGGIAALDSRTGEVRALAGIAFSAPQPPGSTFKIVTTVAGLDEKKVSLADKFPVESHAVIDGVDLDNANGEFCGGTFAESFAHSCNSVFAPLGVKIGSAELVEVAERFGWNSKPTIPGEVPSTMPDAGGIVDPLEVGSTAIGQGEVLATPLTLASVAQTIAAKGLRYPPTLQPGLPRKPIRVTSAATAKIVEGLMAGVVVFGTGTQAQIPGVKVAGKTGTAELEDTKDENGEPIESGPENTDAWFTSYAPIGRPTIAVAAMFVRNGAGGDTAAPAAKTVLQAALER